MKLLFISLFVLVLSGCKLAEEEIVFPVGSYASDCHVDNGHGYRMSLEISENYESQKMTSYIYTQNLICSGDGDVISEVMSEVPLSFSNLSLGEGMSYFSETVEVSGILTSRYRAFKYLENKLYLSSPVENLESEIQDVFAEFIKDPVKNAEVVLNKI